MEGGGDEGEGREVQGESLGTTLGFWELLYVHRSTQCIDAHDYTTSASTLLACGLRIQQMGLSGLFPVLTSQWGDSVGVYCADSLLYLAIGSLAWLLPPTQPYILFTQNVPCILGL